MRILFRRSLRLQLVAILAIALTPLLTLSIIQGAIEFENERIHQIERLRSASAVATDELRSSIERALGIATAIEEGSYEMLSHAERCDSALSRIADADPVISNIVLLDEAGGALCSASSLHDDARPIRELWFERLREGGDTAVSRIVSGSMSEHPIIIAARRRKTDGTFAGAVTVAIDLAQATDALELELLPPGARLGLWDPDSVFALDAEQPLLFDQLPPALLDQMQSGHATIHVRNADFAGGGTVVISPLIDGHIGTVVVSPDGPGYSGWSGYDLVGTVLIPFLMWALAIVCVWIAIDRFVLRWLSYLRRIARLYGSGRLDIDPRRAETAPAEVEELATTLAHMAASLQEQREELENAIDQRTALLREIHHRVKNNLQVIVSLLNLQAGRLPEGPGREALYEARRRINALALVHRSLYEAEDLRLVEMQPFLRELLHYVSDASQSAEQAVEVEVRSEDIDLEPDYAVPLALFVTEAANNAFKHAFEDRKSGRICVVLRRMEGDMLEIAVEDDGSGLAEDAGEGTGSTLMTAFAQQLGGSLQRTRTEEGGARVAICFAYASQSDKGEPEDLSGA